MSPVIATFCLILLLVRTSRTETPFKKKILHANKLEKLELVKVRFGLKLKFLFLEAFLSFALPGLAKRGPRSIRSYWGFLTNCFIFAVSSSSPDLALKYAVKAFTLHLRNSIVGWLGIR